MLQIGLDNMVLVCGMVLALTQTDYQVILGLFGVVVQILLVQPLQSIKINTAGVQVNGFTYRWRVKNGNANLYGNQPAQMTFFINVDVYDSNGNIYASYQYDLSYQHNWSYHTGSETFVDPFLPPSFFSDIIVSAQGSDSASFLKDIMGQSST